MTGIGFVGSASSQMNDADQSSDRLPHTIPTRSSASPPCILCMETGPLIRILAGDVVGVVAASKSLTEGWRARIIDWSPTISIAHVGKVPRGPGM